MKQKRADVIEAIIDLVKMRGAHGAQPTSAIHQQFGLSRQQISRYLNLLVLSGELIRTGNGRGQKYFLNPQGKGVLIALQHLTIAKLADLGEERVYQNYLAPHIARFRPNIISIFHHGFTELTNNVIDHADASHFAFSVTENTASHELIMEIHDDGIGVFRRNQIAFSLDNLYEALVETVKGRRTSQPERHAGEGLFFTSRLFDYFRLRANGIEWLYLSANDDWSMAECPEISGSHLTLKISTQSERKPEDVFNRYTDEDFQFTKNALFVVEPLTIQGCYEHVSRSEAKRLLAGAEVFKHIIIDFKNTERIGQGFADEIFRVFQNQYPNIVIEPRNMNHAVSAMVKHVVRKKKKVTFSP